MNTAEKQAHKSADMIAMLSGDLRLLLFSYSPDLKSLISWSDNIKEVLGARDPDVMRDAGLFLRHVHVEDRFRVLQELEKAFKGDGEYDITYRWIRPDSDRTRLLHARARMMQTPDGELLQGFITDVSGSLKQSNSNTSQNDLYLALDQLESAIITLDVELRVTALNKKAKETVVFEPGFDPEKITTGARFEPSAVTARNDFYDTNLKAVLKGEIPECAFELRDSRHDSQSESRSSETQEVKIRPILDGERIVGVAIFITDASEKHRLAEDLRVARKKQTLVNLSQGVFHNLRNAFQGVLGYSNLLSENPGDTASVKKLSQLISDAITRASDLIDASPVKELEREGENRTTRADLNIAAMEAVSGADEIFGTGISVTVSFGNIPRIKIDQAAVSELAEELIVTLLKKIPFTRDLNLRTSAVCLEKGQIPELAAGDYGKLKITVASMPEEVQAIEEVRSGIEIALNGMRDKAISRGGVIRYDMNKFDNATFTLYIPCEKLRNENVAPNHLETKNDATILLLDDDFVVLDSVTAGLQEKGYSCLAASDLEEATNILKEVQSIEMVIFDNVNPALTPEETCRKLASASSHAKFISLSAWNGDPGVRKSASHPRFVGSIKKPVNVPSLINAVKSGLAENN